LALNTLPNEMKNTIEGRVRLSSPPHVSCFDNSIVIRY
jgi:hypothetical protein